MTVITKDEPVPASFFLDVIEHARSSALREQMNDAGCVFEFVVLRPAPGAPIDETLHRQALQGMGFYLAACTKDWQSAQAGHYLPKVYDPQADAYWAVDKAIATPLDSIQRRHLTLTEGYASGPLALYAAFTGAPYGVRFEGGEAQARSTFQQWLDVLGLHDQDEVVVLNWVNGHVLDWVDETESALPDWTPWSDYFEAGLEWWGIWCLTVWNPQRQTLSVVVASSTD